LSVGALAAEVGGVVAAEVGGQVQLHGGRCRGLFGDYGVAVPARGGPVDTVVAAADLKSADMFGAVVAAA
jgi:hypothetical protein